MEQLEDGKEWDMPMLNVFRRSGGDIRHFWGSELLYVPPEPGQEYRPGDPIDPVWVSSTTHRKGEVTFSRSSTTPDVRPHEMDGTSWHTTTTLD